MKTKILSMIALGIATLNLIATPVPIKNVVISEKNESELTALVFDGQVGKDSHWRAYFKEDALVTVTANLEDIQEFNALALYGDYINAISVEISADNTNWTEIGEMQKKGSFVWVLNLDDDEQAQYIKFIIKGLKEKQGIRIDELNVYNISEKSKLLFCDAQISDTTFINHTKPLFFATDGDTQTATNLYSKWQGGDIIYDFAKATEISSVKIKAGGRITEVGIQASLNGETWSTLGSGKLKSGEVEINFNATEVKFIKFNFSSFSGGLIFDINVQ